MALDDRSKPSGSRSGSSLPKSKQFFTNLQKSDSENNFFFLLLIPALLVSRFQGTACRVLLWVGVVCVSVRVEGCNRFGFVSCFQERAKGFERFAGGMRDQKLPGPFWDQRVNRRVFGFCELLFLGQRFVEV